MILLDTQIGWDTVLIAFGSLLIACGILYTIILNATKSDEIKTLLKQQNELLQKIEVNTRK